jgi:glycosyltransferase involved in cell wall biosynthesis
MKKPHSPMFSIIIPTYQRPARLKKCLEGIARLDYPKDGFEVIVVDDGSTVSLEKALRPFSTGFDLTLVRESHAGPAAARNKGAALARGEFLVFTDDDCVPHPEWLRAFSKRLAVTPDGLIGGAVVNGLPHNPCSSASQLLCDYLYAYHNKEEDNGRFLMSNNMALKKRLFKLSRGFDTDFPWAGGEDRAFSSNWLRRGRRIIYAPEAVVSHTHALTFKTFIRQHFAYGRGAFVFHGKHHHLRRLGGMEPLSFYAELLKYPCRHCRGGRKALLLALFMFSQGAVAAGYFFEKTGDDPGKRISRREIS